MKSLSFLALSLAAAEARENGGWRFGFCPSQPTWYTQNNAQFNFEDILGTWYLVQRPSDLPWGNESRSGCSTGHFTHRPDAWFYKVGMNFGGYNLDTGKLSNMYVSGEPGTDSTWMHGRTDASGNWWVQAMVMPEIPMQVLKTDGSSYLVLNSCAFMGVEHWSGAMIMSRTKSLPQSTLDEIYDFMDTVVPSSEYVARDNLISAYQGDDCKYNEYSP